MQITAPPNLTTWRPASRGDTQALQGFVCAIPPKATYDPIRGSWHPQQWALDVQSAIRGMKIHRVSGELTLLGFIETQLVGVCNFSFDSDAEQFIIRVIASHSNYRNLGIATAGLNIALQVIDSTKRELKIDGGVFVRIDNRNDESKRLFSRFGFDDLGYIPSTDPKPNPNLHHWALMKK